MAALCLGWPPGFPLEIRIRKIAERCGFLEIKQRVCRPEEMRRDHRAVSMTLIRGARESPVTDRVDVKTRKFSHRVGAAGPRWVIRPTMFPRAQQSGRRLNPNCRNRVGRSSSAQTSSPAAATGPKSKPAPCNNSSIRRQTDGYISRGTAKLRPGLSHVVWRTVSPSRRLGTRRCVIREDPSGAVPVCVTRMNRTTTLKMCQGRARGQGKTMTRQSKITEN